MSRYGIPYRGSKSRFADEIIDLLPEGEVLIDMFAGGCAVTHAALEQMNTIAPKWHRVIANDIDKRPVETFQKAVSGGFRDEKRWISRDDFFKLKDTDYYVKMCWSFGNDGKSYMYGKHIEPWKKAMWYARVFDDWSMFEEIIGITVPTEGRQNLRLWIRQNNDLCRERYTAWYGKDVSAARMCDLQSLQRLQSLESLQRLQRLESLESLQSLQSLIVSSKSYEEVDIPNGSVIYCDIPYEKTDAEYVDGFNHKEFYNWAYEMGKKYPLYISSYEINDPRFAEVWCKETKKIVSAVGNGLPITERIYTIKV